MLLGSPLNFLAAITAVFVGLAATGLLSGLAIAQEPPADCLAAGVTCSMSSDCCSGVCHGDGICAEVSCSDSDDPTWSVTLSCEWVAEDPSQRCSLVGILDTSGRSATDACREACGTPCPTSEPSAIPSESPSNGPTVAPTPAPVAPTPAPAAPTPASPDTVKSLSCPDVGSTLSVGLPDGGSLDVGPSSGGTLCTLTEVRSDPLYPSKDVQIIPIARSYDGMPWENVAGIHSEAIFPDGPPLCTSTNCIISLPAEATNSRYVLSSYEHSLSKRDEIARFLDQMTFGVKTSELDAEEAMYDATVDASTWRAQYVKDQIDTPLTSHREWWRKRTNPKMPLSTQNGRSDSPCSKNSRWRRYTFTRHDFLKADNTGTKRLVHFYTPEEDEDLPDPVIYEAEYLAFVAPSGQVPLADTLDEQTNGFYGLCNGDCDEDSDCQGDLICYQREGSEPVPGCYGYGTPGTDYCTDPAELVGNVTLTFTGNPLNPNPGGVCQGDCDSDSQCAGDLLCKQRKSGGPVLGCNGHEAVDPTDDFCYDPTWIPPSWTPPPYSGYLLNSSPKTGYTGTNYLEHSTDSSLGQDKSWAEWTIDIPTDGTYPLSLRYAQPLFTEGDMYIEITVNEGSPDEQVENLLTTYSMGSGDWRYTDYMKANLKAGSNTVKIRNMQVNGANIDHLRVGKAKSTIIEVDGHNRTVVHNRVHYSEGIDSNSDGQSIKYSDASTKHTYEICDFPLFYNVKYPQGRLRVRPQGADDCSNAQAVDSLNPLVDFSGYESYVPGIVFDLPILSDPAWAPASDVQDSNKQLEGYDVLLIDGINDDLCSQVPISAEEGDAPILAKLADGTFLQWSPQLVLEENTVSSPVPTGGGDIVSTTVNTKCMNVPRNFLNEDQCVLSYSSAACSAEGREFEGNGTTLVCGSIGEVSNDHSHGQLFDFAHNMEPTTGDGEFRLQKTKVWSQIAIEGQDQLRQKFAWALSQIFTVVEDNIDAEEETEVYLSYFDIFVRNVFGNFRDILKETSFSPLMATHLTYLGSKSRAFIYSQENGKQSSPDENFAREVMQLFTIGLVQLKADGTSQRDANGMILPTYDNEDIMSFSRSWTGFQAYSPRGNYEQTSTRSNRNLLDPLHIIADWRDRFPKHNLNGGYIGDAFYPLCSDLPEKMFLRKGAKYRLLGSNPLPESFRDHPDLESINSDIKRMFLDTSSDLYAKLYNGGEFKPVVELEQTLVCEADECEVDTVRVVQIASYPPIFYEYVAAPCVHQAFYEGGKQIARRDRDWEGVMCADPTLPVASEACGRNDISSTAYRAFKYTGERMTYATAAARCAAMSSGLPTIPLDDSIGDGQGTGAYGHCQGDCDSDTDCQGNFICFQRDDDTEVPGCSSSNILEQPIPLDVSVGDGQGTNAYGRCQGDCDKDSDCQGNLKCFQRGGNEEVPGCLVQKDELLPDIPLDESVDNNEGMDAYGRCQGDCDRDTDCRGDLICLQRDGDEPVPGCTGVPVTGQDYCVENQYYGSSGDDYCYMPSEAGTTGDDYCIDPYHESGLFEFSRVSGAEYELGYHWTSFDCSVQAKINKEGYVALVHDTDNMNTLPPHVDAEQTLNYFKVYWGGDGSYPSPATGCGFCRLSNDESACICPTHVVDEIVFTDEPASIEEIISNLYIGAVPIDVADQDTFSSQPSINGDFTVHFPQANNGVYTANTIFELSHPYHGTKLFLKNTKSIVHLDWQTTQISSSFRNAPHFMALSQDYDDDGEGETTQRDAYYETDAVLDHYFYHPNVAPFICTRLIQRHGISNPSPGHVSVCSEAFRSGSYSSAGVTFGSGDYGNLEAVIAAITLEPEATTSLLDIDPGYGRIREPFLQPIQMLRSLETEFAPQVYRYELQDLFGRLGQEPHHFATVFSWFLPEYIADVGPTIDAGYVAPESMVLNMPSITAQLNGLTSLAKFGLSDCSLGFGESDDIGSCDDDGSMSRATASFSYTPTATTTAGLVQELNTLLCAGRLSQAKQAKIVAILDEYNPVYDEDGARLRFAYQLIVSSPEFHTNTIVKESPDSRPGLSAPSQSVGGSANDYKAVILLYLSGGVDSFSMVPPHTCADNLYEKYTDIRGGLNTAADPGIALPKETLKEIPTNNPDHVCSSVGLHPNLPLLKDLYDHDDAVFVTNTGLMQFPATKENYKDTRVQLFAHNEMSLETKRQDLEDEAVGSGVLGRMRDKLAEAGFSTSAFSVAGTQVSVMGKPGVTEAAVALSPSGVQKFAPRDSDDLTPDLTPFILSLNNATAIDSPFMAETWSAKVSNSIYQREELQHVLETSTVTTEFTGGKLCDQLETVARVMSTHADRGSERDVFHVQLGGFDMHSNVIEKLLTRFDEVNACLSAFVTELKIRELWNSTVLAQFSEFGRTLDPNSGPNNDGSEKGCDHAWGGNQFAIGGALKRGQVLGQYPTDFTEDGPLALRRGRIIPTTPWDSIWNGIAPWMGVPAEDIDYVLPMRSNFNETSLFTEAMLFGP